MNWIKWKVSGTIKGSVKQQWGKLTDDDSTTCLEARQVVAVSRNGMSREGRSSAPGDDWLRAQKKPNTEPIVPGAGPRN